MLRARHLPFAVDEDARDQWLLCMYSAMDELHLDPALRDHLEDAFFFAPPTLCAIAEQPD